MLLYLFVGYVEFVKKNVENNLKTLVIITHVVFLHACLQNIDLSNNISGD